MRTSAPPPGSLRRYGPARTGPRLPLPITMSIAAVCIVLGLMTLTIGVGLAAGFVGQIAGAFNGALSGLSSHAPATAPPSGVALDTPLLDAPSSGGYTNTASQPILGSVPSLTVGKTGYTVHVYEVGDNGSRT
jgi:hypothetical protein